MKNRRISKKEVLLLYRFRDTEIGQQVLGVAARMGILCRVVESQQTEEVLGTLLKLPGFESVLEKNSQEMQGTAGTLVQEAAEREVKKPSVCKAEELNALSRQMMVLYGFTNERLDEFLRNMRRAGIPRIALKAIVTPHNVNWTFRQLYEELEREEAAYRKN